MLSANMLTPLTPLTLCSCYLRWPAFTRSFDSRLRVYGERRMSPTINNTNIAIAENQWYDTRLQQWKNKKSNLNYRRGKNVAAG